MRRFLLATLSVGVAVAFLAAAGPASQDAEREKRRPLAGPGQLGGPLVPEGIQERLNLTGEQKEKIAKLEKEFADKAKDETKLQDLMKKAREDKDRAAMKEAQEKFAETRKVRESYQAKVADVLNAEQKRAYAQATGGGVKRPGAGVQPQFVPLAIAERLNLTADQKSKLEQLQKEFETKSLQVLTEEQRQQYENFKKGIRRKPE